MGRMAAIHRRLPEQETAVCDIHAHKPLDIGPCHIDLAAGRVLVEGKDVPLTPQEYSLLKTLVENQNLALSRDKLLALAWGYNYGGDTRTVDVHIQKLRHKLKLSRQIQTVYKLGYRLSTE